MSGNKAIHRRISRTDLDFEQALRAEGTVVLREGIDVNTLGVESPALLNRSYSSSTPGHGSRSTPRTMQPSTPTVVPPTPSPGPSAVKPVVLTTPSTSSSSHDVFYDAVDDNSERVSRDNRRSIYRSTGTSSSPDLATLLRVAKDRGNALPSNYKTEKRRESPPPPLPPSTTRQRSSTSANPMSVAPSSFNKDRLKVIDGEASWTPGSPHQTKDNSTKTQKSSIRSKTSALWGKMMGQNTVRERSKGDPSITVSNPPLLNSFIPPTPRVPSEKQNAFKDIPADDVFSSPKFADTTKPLPPIVSNPIIRDEDDADERSMVFVDKVSPLPDLPGSRSNSTELSRGKRRSMSVGDADLKSAIIPVSPTDQSDRKLEAPKWEDTTLHGILDDFKGELSQLDPTVGSSLALKDPSTPARRAARSNTDVETSSSRSTDEERPDVKRSSSTPVTSSWSFENDKPPTTLPAIIPPRSSSLLTPVRLTSIHTSMGSLRTGPSTQTSPVSRARSGLSPNGPRDSNRLRVLHRSTASSSEPSLIPISVDESRTISAPRRSSQQDLTVNDLTLSRVPSTVSGGASSETGDMDTRGKELALRCWNEDEEFLAKEKIAEWLGGNGRINKVALRHYVDFFDFKGLRLDLAFRRLCAKLFLKGETQQVDRILEEFSRRYWECNPGGLYGSANIVHAVAYSLLLLNTDLHVAELATRMSRSQFVRNTVTAIQTQLEPSTPVGQVSMTDLTYDDCSSSIPEAESDDTETVSRSKRSDSIASWNSVSIAAPASSSTSQAPASSIGSHLPNNSSHSVQHSTAVHEQKPSASHQVYGRAWESDMESLLKEMYNAIKSQQILQPLNTNVTRPSSNSLSPGGSSMLRNRSLRSQPDRLATLKRGSIRGLQSILTPSGAISPYSSNSSIDGRASPSPSFATSTNEALYGSSSSFLMPALGFASNLSHTIIREAQEDDGRSIHSNDSNSTTISITDEELALLGAPWAKEGMLCRKQYWESSSRRAKDKTWLDVFVVIQKGELNMFIFGDNGNGGSGTFGGGNWLANARPVGTIQLAHSLAHSLPPPGYNRQRPYCMVLALANGGVYFFQAGTEELVNEWVSTCNYWAARTSKEPLTGGVSNMEYGWNRVADPYGHGRSKPKNEGGRDTDQSDGLSVRSGKSNHSRFKWRDGTATTRAAHSPWGDKLFINDWKLPLPPSVSSVHDEESQLDALRKHVVSMKKELELHNELREPMMSLYQPRSANAMKAQSNWEKKSQYLLTEIVKYDSYVDSLQAAMSLRLKKRGEKALERALSGSSPPEEPHMLGKGKWKGPEEETIREEAEPTTPGPGQQQFGTQHHRRELAEDED